MAAAIEATVRSLYEVYGADFATRDPDAATAHWDAPSIRVSPAGVRLDETGGARRAGFVDALAALDGTGYDHSEPTGIRAHRLGEDLALSSVVWTRRTETGERIARFSPIHVVRRDGERWRFLARTSRNRTEPLCLEAVDPGVDRIQAPDAIRTFFAEYARAFSTLEPERIAEYWHLPTLVVGARGGRAVTDPAGVAALFEPLFDRLTERDYEESALVGVAGHVCDDDVAIADVCWERRAADGAVLDRFATLHLLHRTAAGWRLVAIVRHPATAMVAVRAG